VPVLLPISFRQGMVLLTVFYGTLAAIYVWRVRVRRRLPPTDARPGDASPPPAPA
jgi:hypothetical protein